MWFCLHYCLTQETQCFFDGGYQPTKVYQLGCMTYGHSVDGPAILIDQHRLVVFKYMYICTVPTSGNLTNAHVSHASSSAYHTHSTHVCACS